MTEPTIRHHVKVNQDNENDFRKLFEDNSEEEFFLHGVKLTNEDNHKLVV